MMRVLHRYAFDLERVPRGQVSYVGGIIIRQEDISCDFCGCLKEPFMVKLMVGVKPGTSALPIGSARSIRRVDEEYGPLVPGVLSHYFNPVPAHERKTIPNPSDRRDSTRKGLGIPTRLQALSVLAVLDEACARCQHSVNEIVIATFATFLPNSPLPSQ